MYYVFAVVAAIMIVIVGKTFIKHAMNKPKAGNLVFKAMHPRKILRMMTIILTGVWVFIIIMTLVQQQINQFLLLYIFWFIWTVDIALKNNHGFRVCENGIFLYQDLITWDEFTSAVWEKAKRGNDFFVKINFVRTKDIEKKYAKYVEISADDKLKVEKLLRKHGKSSNR